MYDNDLNDISKQEVEKYSKLYIKWKSCAIGFIVGFIGMFLLGAFSYDETLRTKEQLKQCKSELEENEIKLALEYAIGYSNLHDPAPVNDSTLYDFLINNNAWYPDILLKQAKIESGNYTSSIYRSNNNLFGMKKVYKRPHTQMTSTNHYGNYKNWELSAIDRILWDIFYFDGIKPTREEYLKSMSKYAEDPNYVEKLK